MQFYLRLKRDQREGFYPYDPSLMPNLNISHLTAPLWLFEFFQRRRDGHQASERFHKRFHLGVQTFLQIISQEVALQVVWEVGKKPPGYGWWARQCRRKLSFSIQWHRRTRLSCLQLGHLGGFFVQVSDHPFTIPLSVINRVFIFNIHTIYK